MWNCGRLLKRNSFPTPYICNTQFGKRIAVPVRKLNYVETGSTFESTVQERLKRWGINLTKTGGPNDKGIDLEGVWALNSNESQETVSTGIPVVIQCKNETKKTGVGELRSLEGALTHRKHRTRRNIQQNALGIFASSSGFTKPAIELHSTLQTPMALCDIDISGRISQFLMNNAAQALLPELTVVDSRQLAHLSSIGTQDTDTDNMGIAIAYRGRLFY
eukprot:gb/GECG01000690.1/.p1 GENE.gb/GECG01000690.1/~~gb/GECG01000690.1/.p1  ORF type:complete len:219 (+),score=26.77 gb/GECG01000690.1/:1-657(+)